MFLYLTDNNSIGLRIIMIKHHLTQIYSSNSFIPVLSPPNNASFIKPFNICYCNITNIHRYQQCIVTSLTEFVCDFYNIIHKKTVMTNHKLFRYFSFININSLRGISFAIMHHFI